MRTRSKSFREPLVPRHGNLSTIDISHNVGSTNIPNILLLSYEQLKLAVLLFRDFSFYFGSFRIQIVIAEITQCLLYWY